MKRFVRNFNTYFSSLEMYGKYFNHWRNFFLENYKIGNDTWRMYFHWRIVLCWMDTSARHDNLKSCLNSYIILTYFSSLFSILPLILYVSENEPIFLFIKIDCWNKLNLLNLSRDPLHT